METRVRNEQVAKWEIHFLNKLTSHSMSNDRISSHKDAKEKRA